MIPHITDWNLMNWVVAIVLTSQYLFCLWGMLGCPPEESHPVLNVILNLILLILCAVPGLGFLVAGIILQADLKIERQEMAERRFKRVQYIIYFLPVAMLGFLWVM